MYPELPKNITNKIESLCELGCTKVRQIIKKADAGNKIEELAEFSHAESKLIVDELSDIMSVCYPSSMDEHDTIAISE